MIFRPYLARAVLDGRKTVTRRPVSDNPRSPYHPDRVAAMVDRRITIQPGRGVRRIATARVERVVRELFDPAQITHEESEAEGFSTAIEFMSTWRLLHGDLEPVDVWRIEFEGIEAA